MHTATAAHILGKQYPNLTTDDVSRYVAHLKESLGPARSSAIYSLACRAAPVGENPMGIKRGSVVEIEGDQYLVLGCGFMTLELANTARPGEYRTLNADEFVRLISKKMTVFDPEKSSATIESLING